MSEVWVNGHYFNGRIDVDFGQPSAATHDFDQGNGLVNVFIVEKKYSSGMKLLMLGNGELCGDERWKIVHPKM